MVASICIKCKGRGFCGRPCEILAKFVDNAPKISTHFSGSTPPEIFVGKFNYPRVYSGILSPAQHGETQIFSTPEEWYSKHLTIEQILTYRGQMIYGRNLAHIKSQKNLSNEMQELALSSKPVSTEFFLKKQPNFGLVANKIFQPMTHPAPLHKVILEENPKVDKKVDYVVSDYDVKSTTALKELYKYKIQTSHLQKLLSAGLLGVKTARKLVPTRWAITAVDDLLSKDLMENIKLHPVIGEPLLFTNDFNGNHYEILLLPERFSFEVIEAEMPGNVWNPSQELDFMQDYEGFFNRKTYASNVTGGYYANRLGVCEFLDKIKRQASVLVIREVRPEYYAPLGVGVLRETTRDIFNKVPEKPRDIEEALKLIQTRLKIPMQKIKEISFILKNYKKQRSLKDFF